MRFAIGLIVSFVIGAACRYFDIPVGSPAVLPGALVVLAMTMGYSSTNRLLSRKAPATTGHLCGGPSGKSAILSETVSSDHAAWSRSRATASIAPERLTEVVK